MATIGVLAGLLIAAAGHPQVDPWITLIVAEIIARTGWKIVRASVPLLVDERAVDPANIREVAEHVHGVRAALSSQS
jgi:divalent metal cation (Fe/Co/Zn/Cd) transporter